MSKISIIAGEHGGRAIEALLSKNVHPMSERMRGALFNTLGDLSGFKVFDPYGGSGALALEAISRGADSAQILEIDQAAFKMIQSNIQELKLDEVVKVSRANCISWLNNTDEKYHIILADPPYWHMSQTQLETISKHLVETGIFVLSHPEEFEFETDLKPIDHKSFASGNLSFYTKIGLSTTR